MEYEYYYGAPYDLIFLDEYLCFKDILTFKNVLLKNFLFYKYSDESSVDFFSVQINFLFQLHILFRKKITQELTIIYGMNSFVLFCSCVPSVSSYIHNGCACGRTYTSNWTKGQFLLLFSFYE